MDSRIFISLAAYRDPELLPTVRDALANARHPERLAFGICWQRAATDDDLREFAADSRFRILDVPYVESRGVCWARHEIQQLLRDEDFYFQIDSHTRFAEGWDEQLLTMFGDLGDERAVIGSYPPSYKPGFDGYRNDRNPNRMTISRFHPDGNVCLEPKGVLDYEQLSRAFPARFASGGFMFASARLPRAVPYDPSFYFSGEEIGYTVRAFTHGFNLYNPHRAVIWHYYTRQGSLRHWDDHQQAPRSQEPARRLRQLLGQADEGVDLGPYGLGAARTLADYRNWAGVDVARKMIHRQARDGGIPPHDPSDEAGWRCDMKRHELVLRWAEARLVLPDDVTFVAVMVDDQHRANLFRRDFPGTTILEQGGRLPCEFECDRRSRPTGLVIWAHSQSAGWEQRCRAAFGASWETVSAAPRWTPPLHSPSKMMFDFQWPEWTIHPFVSTPGGGPHEKSLDQRPAP